MNRSIFRKSVSLLVFICQSASIFLAFALFTFAFADQVPTVSTDDFLGAFLTSLGGFKGAGVLGSVVIVTQLLIKFSGTKWGDIEGHYKLMIILGLSWVGGIVGLMVTQHLSFVAALLHSTSLAAFQVFGNEAYSQFGQALSPPMNSQSTGSSPPSS